MTTSSTSSETSRIVVGASFKGLVLPLLVLAALQAAAIPAAKHTGSRGAPENLPTGARGAGAASGSLAIPLGAASLSGLSFLKCPVRVHAGSPRDRGPAHL